MEIKKAEPIAYTGPTELAGVKPASTVAKTPAPAEEKKGLFARLREKREARKAAKEAEKNSTAKMKKGGIMKYKTGGMVNPNAILQADKKAGSKGVKHSLSAKAILQKIAKGRSGGTSAAPKTALPKAQYGFSTPSKPPSDSPKPTLIQPANNPLANKPKRYLAYKDGIRPTLVTKKSVGSKTRVKKG
jgi:hypothetical protein